MVKMLVNIVVMILVNVWLRLGFGPMILAVVGDLSDTFECFFVDYGVYVG